MGLPTMGELSKSKEVSTSAGRPNIEVQHRIIGMGAGHCVGHWLQRYVVVEDGHVMANMFFTRRKDAEHRVQHIIWDWEEQQQ